MLCLCPDAKLARTTKKTKRKKKDKGKWGGKKYSKGEICMEHTDRQRGKPRTVPASTVDVESLDEVDKGET